MKVFGLTLSQHFGCIFVIIIVWKIKDIIRLYLELPYGMELGISILIFFCLYWLISTVSHISVLCALGYKYSFAIFFTRLCWIFDISESNKRLEIYSLLEKGVGVEKISEFFEDKEERIQYISLLLYAEAISINPVLKWFEEKYTSKNLPIDKYFLPVYEYCLEKQNYA